MTIELRHLRYFLAVADAGHVTRAATQLGMAQPPLSQQIAKLEQIIGAPLFVRQPRGVTLTDAGLCLVEDARRLLQDAERATERARRAARGEVGRLRLGMINSAPFHPRITALIQDYRARYPKVALHLEEGTTPELARAVLEDRLDVALVRPLLDDWPGLSRELLFEEPTMVALPATHSLAQRRRIPLMALSLEPFVLFPRTVGAGLHDAILKSCLDAGFSPRVVQEASQVTSIVNLVAAGLGVSIVPQSMQQLQAEGICFVAIQQPAPIARMDLIFRSNVHVATTHQFRALAHGTPLNN